MNKRPSQVEYFMQLAKVASLRSNCYRRQVGCVAVDKKNNVLATGYNGVPPKVPHCKQGECPRETPGQDLDKCLAIHAEMNAVMQCSNKDKIDTIYVTESPCLICTTILLNTGCNRIVFQNEYPGSQKSKEIWEARGGSWFQYTGRWWVQDEAIEINHSWNIKDSF